MKILYRETIKEFVLPLIWANLIMTGILLLDRIFLLIDLLIKKGVSFRIVCELMLYSLPFVLSFSTPIGVLIASIISFGRISQDNELVAIRSLGINPLKLFMPVGIFVLTLSLFMIFFNGYILPESMYRARNLLADISQKKPTLRIYEKVFIEDFSGYVLYFGNVDEKTGNVKEVSIWQKQGFGLKPTLIQAQEGKIFISPDEKYLIVRLKNGTISELLPDNKYRHINFTDHEINLEVNWELIRRERKYRSPRELLHKDLYKRMLQSQKELKNLKNSYKALEKKQNNDVTNYYLSEILAKMNSKTQEYLRYSIEIEKRHALAISCLLLLFLGSGLGMLLRRSGLGFGFVLGLLVYAGYYIIFLASEEFSYLIKISPPVLIWLANFILIPSAIEILSITITEESFLKRLKRHFVR
ncbi:MAG: LptF/LptG family permease [candidate division WOR-3 bacterium]|nr:LptF/LptG family permease [candidate division WOR-3 bacterium]MDW7987783.1 LptF/LptG family permease [candidate division WOR-3 bacterium]